MLLLSEVLGSSGVFSLVDTIYESGSLMDRASFDDIAMNNGVVEEMKGILIREGLFNLTPQTIALSTFGMRIALLLRIVNGAEDIAEGIRKLTELYPQLRPFDLVTQNITDYVLDTVSMRRDFIRLYICSPWIRLKSDNLIKFKSAILTASARYPSIQIFIITLPLNRYNDPEGIQTLRELQSLGAQVMTHERLHAKLYISEPGPQGGSHYAVFGSENLTGANNIELGIKIEGDNQILSKLSTFFLDIQQDSTLL